MSVNGEFMSYNNNYVYCNVIKKYSITPKPFGNNFKQMQQKKYCHMD